MGSREGTGISAGSLFVARDVYKHPDWRLVMKKKLVAGGVLAAIMGVAAAVFQSRRKYINVGANCIGGITE